MNNSSKNMTIYKNAESFLEENLPNGVSKKDLEKYFEGDAKNSIDLKDVFFEFIRSAQDYQMMSNVIKLNEREKQIREILSGNDYKSISNMNEKNLYKEFVNKFEVSSKNKNNCWHKWSCAIIDTARFIIEFSDLEDFREYVKRFDYNAETRMALSLLISVKIRGIGFALACNALKELGYLNYSKPDVHLIDIFEGLGLSGRSPYEVFEAIDQMAKDNDVTPYKVDKVMWLISSGKYYKHNITDTSRKGVFIQEMRGKLGL